MEVARLELSGLRYKHVPTKFNLIYTWFLVMLKNSYSRFVYILLLNLIVVINIISGLKKIHILGFLGLFVFSWVSNLNI